MTTTVKLLKKQRKKKDKHQKNQENKKTQRNGHANKIKAYFLNPPIK